MKSRSIQEHSNRYIDRRSGEWVPPDPVFQPVRCSTPIGRVALPCMVVALGSLIYFSVPQPEKEAEKGPTIIGHDNQINSLAFAPDGRTLATASQDRTVRLWNLQKRKTEAILRCDASVASVAYDPSGRHLATAAEDGLVTIWDAASAKLIQELEGGSKARAVTFAPDGRAVGSCDETGRIRVWEPDTGRLLIGLQGSPAGLNTLAWAPDGRTLAAAGTGGRVQIWNLVTGTHTSFQASENLSHILAISISPDGKELALAGPFQKNVTVWDVASGRERTRLSGHTNWVSCVAFSRDGRFLASGSADGTVRLWEEPSGKLVTVFLVDGSLIKTVAFSPDGSLLVSAGTDGAAHFWSVPESVR